MSKDLKIKEIIELMITHDINVYDIEEAYHSQSINNWITSKPVVWGIEYTSMTMCKETVTTHSKVYDTHIEAKAASMELLKEFDNIIDVNIFSREGE